MLNVEENEIHKDARSKKHYRPIRPEIIDRTTVRLVLVNSQ
jgi:hypothetical protein